MRASLTKVFTFEAAHQLPNHAGKCRDLHGHSYRVEVSVAGDIKPPRGLSDDGMVVDFDVLKAIWKEYCEPALDHRFLNDSIGPSIAAIIGADTAPTTAENIAMWIAREFSQMGAHGAVSVRVWETATGSATVTWPQ